jgi:hypothetical protein
MSTSDSIESIKRKGWTCIGKFNEISPFIDEQRDYLEAIVRYKRAESLGWIADSGYPMPPVGRIAAHRVYGIELVPEHSSDGYVMVKTDPFYHSE